MIQFSHRQTYYNYTIVIGQTWEWLFPRQQRSLWFELLRALLVALLGFCFLKQHENCDIKSVAKSVFWLLIMQKKKKKCLIPCFYNIFFFSKLKTCNWVLQPNKPFVYKITCKVLRPLYNLYYLSILLPTHSLIVSCCLSCENWTQTQ